MDVLTPTEAVRETPFLAGLGRTEQRRIAELGRLVTLETGRILLREGDPTTHLGIVRSGRVALRAQVPGRGAVTFLTVEKGDIFGWSAVVPPYRATSTAIAVEPSEALLFEARALRDALERDDELAAALYPRLLRSVARRLEATRLQLLDLFGTGEGQPW
jgi:CRP/FNR family cyclic AMP-dependent transcriptional regulator